MLRPDENEKLGRLLCRRRGRMPGPTLIAVGGIHGNEPAGVHAVRRVADSFARHETELRGEFLGLAGNTQALARELRYVDVDLNRHWMTTDTVAPGRGHATVPRHAGLLAEDVERMELLDFIDAAVARARGDVFLIDLHTTSGGGLPFATIGDTLRNRRFALRFPVPIVLGLEEEVQSTLLEYINGLGHVTMGFEAGRHNDEASVDNHEALIWHALVAAGLVREDRVPELDRHRRTLRDASRGAPSVFEIRYRHPVTPDDAFTMLPGRHSFEKVQKGEILANDRDGNVVAPEAGLLLLPLYQGVGDDGFFIGRSVRPLWLRLSALLRRLRFDRLIVALPGIRRHPGDPASLIVDTHVARLYPLEVFHLLGYRRRRWIGDELVVTRRAHDLSRGR
jgi:succinylglutamate desuccinylase